MLIAGIVSIINSIPLSIRTIYSYSKHYLGVTARGQQEKIDEIRDILTYNAPVDVSNVIPARVSEAEVKSIVGSWPFVFLGLSGDDMQLYLDRVTGGAPLDGRLPISGRPEAVVSRPVAKNLRLGMGGIVMGPSNKAGYSRQEVEIVGIVDSEEWVLFTSYEYHHENHFPPIDVLLAFADDPADQEEFDRWAEKAFEGSSAKVFAYHNLEEETNEMFATLYKILNVIIFLLVSVITFMMAMLMSIYLQQRVPEFGLLQAIGYSKKSLLRRVLAETLIVLAGGWVIGVLCAYGMLLIVRAKLMEPNAFMLDPLDKAAYFYSAPVPLAILAAAVLTVVLKFRKFDPVAVVERRLI
jgi:hypothetical protein